MILNLKSQLKPVLKEASAFYIATALITEAGYNFIETNVHDNCNRNYLVGIDLAISPKILQKLLDQNNKGNANTKICKPQYTFHPKVYLVEKTDGTFVGFIGSANTTEGGLSNNIEISVSIDSQEQCCEILNWFKNTYNSSFDITESFIEEYERTYHKLKQRQSSNNSDIKAIEDKFFKIKNPILNLNHQFFKNYHFDAYAESNHLDYSQLATNNRKRVSDNFKLLHNKIYKHFSNYDLDNFHKHPNLKNIVSLHYHTAFNRRVLDAIWLHYGSSQKEFLNHPRMQVILRHNYIGIWLVIGKDQGSQIERTILKTKIDNSEIYKQLLFKNVQDLGGSYWLDVNGKNYSVQSIKETQDLRNIIVSDNIKNYFIIGRNYDISDPDISESNMGNTVLLEFQRLNQVYKTICLVIGN